MEFTMAHFDNLMNYERRKNAWTLDEVRQRALSLGKAFEPNPEIVDRVSDDLSKNGVIVLFTPDEVNEVISMGAVPEEMKEGLINLVSPEGLNDIAIIPAGAIEEAQRQKLVEWFLTNNRC